MDIMQFCCVNTSVIHLSYDKSLSELKGVGKEHVQFQHGQLNIRFKIRLVFAAEALFHNCLSFLQPMRFVKITFTQLNIYMTNLFWSVLN